MGDTLTGVVRFMDIASPIVAAHVSDVIFLSRRHFFYLLDVRPIKLPPILSDYEYSMILGIILRKLNLNADNWEH